MQQPNLPAHVCNNDSQANRSRLHLSLVKQIQLASGRLVSSPKQMNQLLLDRLPSTLPIHWLTSPMENGYFVTAVILPSEHAAAAIANNMPGY